MKLTEKRFKYTFLTSIFVGLAAHLFALTNVLQNYDNISQTPVGVGTGVTSGRWVIELLSQLHIKYGVNYNIPMVNGLIAIFLLSVSVCLIIDVLNIQSVPLCCVFAGIFISFPVVTSSMFFMYVVEYNSLAAFLAVLAVWLARKYHWIGLVGGTLCLAVSLGIYQAYLPMTASLFVILLLKEVLSGKSRWLTVLCRGVLDLFTMILGFAAYYGCMKWNLAKHGAELSDYQGINNMGNISLRSLPGLLKRAVGDIVKMPFIDYYGISSTVVVRIAIVILAIISFVGIVYLLWAKKARVSLILECILLCMIFPLAVNGITIMCSESKIYTMMVYGSVFIFLMPVMIMDLIVQNAEVKISKLSRRKLYLYGRNSVAALLILVTVQYVWLSNGNYMAMYYNTEQTKAYLSSMLTQVRMTEGFNTSLSWAFIGKVSDETFHNQWKDSNKFHYGGNGVTEEKPLVNYYSRKSWFWHYMGYVPNLVDNDQVKELRKDPYVKNMPCYPDYGSIAIYKDTVIIKLSD